MILRALTLCGITLIAWVFGSGFARADVPPVEITVAESTAWTGERVPIRIELRAPGSFFGSAAFDLPEIPGTLLLKVGNPVVGSKEIENESWFVQTHEFALFSQKTGTVTIPSFPVRFEAREGFTGDAKPIVAKTESVSIEIQRPPGSEVIPFLVTTENLEISETWDPDPGQATAVKVGDVFRRTIVQRSRGLTGMALVPASTLASEGVRVYKPQVETKDNTERGAFDGERRETLTYLLQEPGTLALPELNFTWWNPKSESLERKTLPGVFLEVEAAPVSESSQTSENSGIRSIWGAAFVCLFLLAIGKRRCLSLFGALKSSLFRPAKLQARALLRACHRNDASRALRAWEQWQIISDFATRPSPELKGALIEMYRIQFGISTVGGWSGERLASAFREELVARRKQDSPGNSSALPPMNDSRRL